MIGLIDSIEPSMACAPPMRPPLRRYSSVSSAANTCSRCAARLDLAHDLVERRRRRARGAPRASTRLPMPIDALSESMISIGGRAVERLGRDLRRLHRRRQPRRQVDADDRRRRRRRSGAGTSPRTRRPTAPTVSGSTDDAASSRQNASTLSSLRSTNSRSPKRIVSGTTSMPSSSQIGSGRSHALSVTMRTGMRPPRGLDLGLGSRTQTRALVRSRAPAPMVTRRTRSRRAAAAIRRAR